MSCDTDDPNSRGQWFTRPAAYTGCLAVLVSTGLLGCSQNPNLTNQQATWQQQQQQMQQYVAQLREAQRRANNLDVNNRDLHSQLAQSQQQLHRLSEENSLLKQRLDETATQLAQTLSAKQQADKRVEALEASVRQRGGASITANNSLRTSLPLPELQGVQVRRDGEVIRIEMPTDSLFLPGGATLHQGAFPIIDQVATAVTRMYPNQIIVIEGHTDNSPILGGPGSSNVQLSLAQAMAVYQQLTTRHRMNERQLRVLGNGMANPIVSNATTAGKTRNRRVEIAIYPETVNSMSVARQ
jgi:flagellar motor protein MotB